MTQNILMRQRLGFFVKIILPTATSLPNFIQKTQIKTRVVHYFAAPCITIDKEPVKFKKVDT